jgi:hypothetical protein
MAQEYRRWGRRARLARLPAPNGSNSNVLVTTPPLAYVTRCGNACRPYLRENFVLEVPAAYVAAHINAPIRSERPDTPGPVQPANIVN